MVVTEDVVEAKALLIEIKVDFKVEAEVVDVVDSKVEAMQVVAVAVLEV